MRRFLIVIVAIAFLLGFSLVNRSLASNSHQGTQVTSGSIIQNGDCKGEKKDDC